VSVSFDPMSILIIMSSEMSVICVPDEVSLFEAFLDFFHYHDPDIITGYEIHASSWGYLIERGHALGSVILELMKLQYSGSNSYRCTRGIISYFT
jgi:DNA polymerase elongation subunit (family B)